MLLSPATVIVMEKSLKEILCEDAHAYPRASLKSHCIVFVPLCRALKTKALTCRNIEIPKMCGDLARRGAREAAL